MADLAAERRRLLSVMPESLAEYAGKQIDGLIALAIREREQELREQIEGRCGAVTDTTFVSAAWVLSMLSREEGR